MKKQPKDLLSKLLNTRQDNAMEQGIRMISVYDMIPNPENHYGIREIEKLAAQIKTTCNVEQLTVKPMPDGKYMIISGHRRREAVVQLLEEGFKGVGPEISCKVVTFSAIGDKSAEEVEKQYLITANKGQRSYSTIDEQLWEIDTLRPIVKKDYDADLKAGIISGPFRQYFAIYLGTSSSALQRLESLRNLTPRIRKDIDEGIITATAAAELAGLDQEKQTLIVTAIKASGKELTVKAIKEFKNKEAKPKNPENVAPPIMETTSAETETERPSLPTVPTETASVTPTNEESTTESPISLPDEDPNESVHPTESQSDSDSPAKIPEEEPADEPEPLTETETSSAEKEVNFPNNETPAANEDAETVRRQAKEWVIEKLQSNIHIAKEQLSSEHINSTYWESCIVYLEHAKQSLLSA